MLANVVFWYQIKLVDVLNDNDTSLSTSYNDVINLVMEKVTKLCCQMDSLVALAESLLEVIKEMASREMKNIIANNVVVDGSPKQDKHTAKDNAEKDTEGVGFPPIMDLTNVIDEFQNAINDHFKRPDEPKKWGKEGYEKFQSSEGLIAGPFKLSSSISLQMFKLAEFIYNP